jgi:hypothetical protein
VIKLSETLQNLTMHVHESQSSKSTQRHRKDALYDAVCHPSWIWLRPTEMPNGTRVRARMKTLPIKEHHVSDTCVFRQVYGVYF